MSSVDEQLRDVILSRASSRKQLASTVHEILLPMLQQHANNLEYLKRKCETLEQRLDALTMEPHA